MEKCYFLDSGGSSPAGPGTWLHRERFKYKKKGSRTKNRISELMVAC